MIKLIDILDEIKVNQPFRWVNFKAEINDEDEDYALISLSNEKDNNKNIWYGHIEDNNVNIEFENSEKSQIQDLIDLLKKGDKKYNVRPIDDEFTYVTFDKSLVDIVYSLDEIKVVNSPYRKLSLGWWLNKLPQPYRNQAIKNLKDCGNDEKYKNMDFYSICDSLDYAFVWKDTPEGQEYWRDVDNKLDDCN